MTYLSSPRAEAFRLAPRSSLCSSQSRCWLRQIHKQCLAHIMSLCNPCLQQAKAAELEAHADLHGTPDDAEQQMTAETDRHPGGNPQ